MRETFMKKLTLVVMLLIPTLMPLSASAEARIAPLRAVFISGSAEYESDKTMPILKKHLEAQYPSVVTILNAKGQTDLPGLEALEKCEVAVLFTRRLELKGDQLERIKKYCTSGKPLVGIRTASHGIQSWLEIDTEVWGGNYKGHYKVGPVCEVKFTERPKESPILDGVKPFKSKGSLYKNTGLAKDVDVLLTGSIPDHSEPIAWTRMVKGGRVFYTSLGAQSDFEDENFLRLMTNGILWAANRAPRKK
jgi:type 1 glutamine amidotransferase